MKENRTASKLQFIFLEQGFMPDIAGMELDGLTDYERNLLELCRENK